MDIALALVEGSVRSSCEVGSCARGLSGFANRGLTYSTIMHAGLLRTSCGEDFERFATLFILRNWRAASAITCEKRPCNARLPVAPRHLVVALTLGEKMYLRSLRQKQLVSFLPFTAPAHH